MVYAHFGGRHADIAYAHDGRLETPIKIDSAWGTFEWLLTNGFPLGHRSGVGCNSDGHKSCPGASYPGAASFGAYGGLTCFLTDELSRDGLFNCLRRCHHYGTTGCRMHLDLRAHFAGGATLFDRNPNLFRHTACQPVYQLMMGDIIETGNGHATLTVEIAARAPIEWVEIRNGAAQVEIYRPYGADDLGERLRVIWSGAEYHCRGRQRQWRGRARFSGREVAKINAWNPERLLEQRPPDTVVWDALTTGNFGGFYAYLAPGASSRLQIITNHGDLTANLDDLRLKDVVLDAGGLGRQVRDFRLPLENPHREVSFTTHGALTAQGDNPLWVCVTLRAVSKPGAARFKPLTARRRGNRRR